MDIQQLQQSNHFVLQQHKLLQQHCFQKLMAMLVLFICLMEQLKTLETWYISLSFVFILCFPFLSFQYIFNLKINKNKQKICTNIDFGNECNFSGTRTASLYVYLAIDSEDGPANQVLISSSKFNSGGTYPNYCLQFTPNSNFTGNFNYTVF